MGDSKGSSNTENGEIYNVVNFVERVLEYRNDPKWDGYIHFFRGHADKGYKLEPSLFRDTAYKQNEDVMFREIIASNPSDFANDRSTFDKLARMQHYGMPTRLLDITTNPLMALYFASMKNAIKTNAINDECKETCNKDCNKKCGKVETDGDVIIISVHRGAIKFFDSDTTSVIANLARMDNAAKDRVKEHAIAAIEKNTQDIIEYFNGTKENEVQRLIHFIRDEKPFFQPKIVPEDIERIICVKSKMSNLRISSQAGAFLLFGHGSVLEGKGRNGTECFNINHIWISGASKEKIRKELDLLDINESTAFAYIENSAKYIKAKYTNQEGASGKRY